MTGGGAGAIDPGALLSDAITQVGDGVEDVAPKALVVGGGILALGIAWRFAKRFVRG